MNTTSLACQERTRKASEVRKKNGQIFEPKMFGLQLYHRNAAPSTSIKRGSNGPAYQMRKIRQKKMEGERTEGKTRDQIAKKKKKKKKKEHLHAHKFSHRDPCVMTFRKFENLAVLDCKE